MAWDGWSRTVAVLLTALAWVALPGVAGAATKVDGTFELTSRAPAAPTGLHIRAYIRRTDDPNAKPPPLRSAVVYGPTGLRFDTSTLRACTASDPELQARGADACPPESALTVGSFTGVTGFGPPIDPVVGDDHVFNGSREFIEVITQQGSSSPAIAVDHLTIDGSTLTAHPPRAPGGPPDGEGSVRSLEFRIPVRTSGGKSLITTPPVCPPSGHWTARAAYSFGDGSSYTGTASTPCARGARTDRRLRLSVRPRLVRIGRRVRLRFRVRSNAPGCVNGARVRVGGHRATTDSRGRAALTLRFRRAGYRSVRATRSGCGRAAARLRVVSAAR